MSRLLLLPLLFVWLFTHAASADPSSAKEIKKRLEKTLAGRGDLVRRSIKRLGNKNIGMEAMISSSAEYEKLPILLSDFRSYAKWLPYKINERPTGGSFYVKLVKIWHGPRIDQIGLHYRLDLPLFKYEGRRTFDMKFKQHREGYTVLSGKSIPSKNPEAWDAEAVAHFFPATDQPNRTWIYVKGKVNVKKWLVYQALPDRILNREVGTRIELILGNYLRAEDGLRAQVRKVKSNQSPTRKTAKEEKPPSPPPQKSP